MMRLLLSLPGGNIAARGKNSGTAENGLQPLGVKYFHAPFRGLYRRLYHVNMSRKVTPQQAAIIHAVDKAGGQSALARVLRIRPQAVQKWCARGSVPALRVLAVEAATGVSRKALRPDIYP
jgi:DNA-binding transcriptional regulator YdaS (Cro superfamily)